MIHFSCFFSPVGCVERTLGHVVIGGVFSQLTNWILGSVQWFLDAAGHVLASTGEPSMIIQSASIEYGVLLTIAPGLLMVGLLVATLQAVRHGDSASLWRVYFGVAPACVFAIFVARPIAKLVLEAVDQLSTNASSAAALHLASLSGAITLLTPSIPGFGLFVLAIAVVVGTFLLWCELIVRAVVLTLLLVLVPVVVPLSTFPAGRRLGWRLAETFIAAAVSKFLIVITLTLGFDELLGSSATQVITGAVTLMLATFSPFILLKLIPFVEASAIHNVEGLRSRFTRSATSMSSSPVGMAARALRPEPPDVEPAPRPDDLGLEMWEGTPEGPMPPLEGERPPPPIGTPTLRGGHVAYHSDAMGPVVGWHFDE
jgi:hypothetical protein